MQNPVENGFTHSLGPHCDSGRISEGRLWPCDRFSACRAEHQPLYGTLN